MVKDDFFKALIEEAWDVFGLKYRLISGFVFTGAVILVFVRKYAADRLLIGSGYLQTFLVVFLLWPTAGRVQQQPVKNAAAFAEHNNLNMVLWMDNPSFSVYRQRVTPWRKPLPGEIALTKITRLKKLENYEILFKEGGIVIVRLSKAND
jgi:hypothetical protein